MTNEELTKAIRMGDWEFSNLNTQYLTHNIHRYSGKFIPQIAGKAIELLTQPGEKVLDSYMGSGTTLLESMLLGRNATGIDLNPLALLISKVKTTRIKNSDMTEINVKLIPFIQSLSNDGQLSFIFHSYDEEQINEQISLNQWRLKDSWYQKWYQKDILLQLVQIFSCIETIQNEKAKDIALVAFSDILRKTSNASSKYPNVMLDKNAKKKQLPAKTYLESLKYIINAVYAMTKATSGISTSTEICLHNNLTLQLEAESIDAIISHPPYIAAIPYAEYGLLSLTWLGYDYKKLDAELTGGKRQSTRVVSRFIEDYRKYFIESYRVLKPEKYMFLMVGNPVVHGEKIDLEQLTVNFARQAGFEHIDTTIRHGQNRRGNRMGDEYLIFFQKH